MGCCNGSKLKEPEVTRTVGISKSAFSDEIRKFIESHKRTRCLYAFNEPGGIRTIIIQLECDGCDPLQIESRLRIDANGNVLKEPYDTIYDSMSMWCDKHGTPLASCINPKLHTWFSTDYSAMREISRTI